MTDTVIANWIAAGAAGFSLISLGLSYWTFRTTRRDRRHDGEAEHLQTLRSTLVDLDKSLAEVDATIDNPGDDDFDIPNLDAPSESESRYAKNLAFVAELITITGVRKRTESLAARVDTFVPAWKTLHATAGRYRAAVKQFRGASELGNNESSVEEARTALNTTRPPYLAAANTLNDLLPELISESNSLRKKVSSLIAARATR